jgi:serine/threonine protein kinase
MIPLLGKTLNKRYRIEEHIGRGGMAEVYRAFDQQRGVYLALKVLREDLAEDAVFIRRFEREAKTLAELQHPNIVRFYGFERSDGYVYMLMEFIEGKTLRKIISERAAPFNEKEVLEILDPVCRALHFAHQSGRVHCDVKSANILIQQDGHVYLTDFGIARGMDMATSTMVGIGTPAYMAPELIKGEDPTPQTDIYALGIVLYEMLTGGERPFTGERAEITGTTVEKVRWEHLMLEPTPMSSFNREISQELEKVVMRCLEKDQENRFQHVQDLLFSLEQATHIQPSAMKEKSDVTGQTSKQPAIRSFEEERKTTQKTKPMIPPATLPEKPVQERKTIFSGLGWLLAGLFVVILLILYIQRVPRAVVIASPTSTISPTLTATPILTPTPVFGVGSTYFSPIDGMTLVYVPAGEFLMGSEEGDSDESPIHTVYLDAFWIDQTEVTNAQYQQCVEDGACSLPGETYSWSRNDYYGNNTYADYPIILVNWDQANDYCEWAGRRLPSEAEWEKAARGTDGRTYPWGEESPNADLANYGRDVDYTTKVGSYPAGASPYGALDMAGNVMEWVADWYDGGYYDSSPLENPQGPASGNWRTGRGGAWDSYGESLRSAGRVIYNIDDSDFDIGFRCALSPEF